MKVQRRIAYLQKCMNIHPPVGQVVALVQSLNRFEFAEMNWLWKMDVFYGADGSSYHSNSKVTCWKSYMSAIQGCAVRRHLPGLLCGGLELTLI